MVAKRTDNPTRTNIYLPGDMVERVKDFAEKYASVDPAGRRLSFSDAIRVLVADALARAGGE